MGCRVLIAPLGILNGTHRQLRLGFNLIEDYLIQPLIWWLQAVAVGAKLWMVVAALAVF
jgi:hypothetical protein